MVWRRRWHARRCRSIPLPLGSIPSTHSHPLVHHHPSHPVLFYIISFIFVIIHPFYTLPLSLDQITRYHISLLSVLIISPLALILEGRGRWEIGIVWFWVRAGCLCTIWDLKTLDCSEWTLWTVRPLELDPRMPAPFSPFLLKFFCSPALSSSLGNQICLLVGPEKGEKRWGMGGRG